MSEQSNNRVRIVYLPPMTVASIHVTGRDEQGRGPENVSGEMLDAFIRDNDLKTKYPAARHFGFNNPDELPDNDPAHGYERWISIPDDMDVPAPFVKKYMEGGLYAAYCIPMDAWEEWGNFVGWAMNNADFAIRYGSVPGVCGWMEEHLNYWDWNAGYMKENQQIDLLIPVSPKKVTAD